MAGTTSVTALTLAAVLLTAQLAHAKRPKTGSKATGPALEEIALMLSSSDRDELRTAIDAAASHGSSETMPLLAERVRAGLPPDLLDAAIDALTLLAEPMMADLFVELATHRRPGVRARAVQALTASPNKHAHRVLLAALGDSNAAVREAAADGLGALADKSALDALFQAFDHGNGRAANAIGLVCTEAAVPRVLAYFGRVPLTSLTPMFDALLARRNLSEAAKLRVVAQLQELGTADARAYLVTLSAKLPADAPVRLRRAVEDAIGRIAVP